MSFTTVFEVQEDAESIELRIQGLGPSTRGSPVGGLFAGTGAGLIAVVPSLAFLYGPTGLDYLPHVLAYAGTVTALGFAAGLLRFVAAGGHQLPTTRTLRVGHRGVTLDGVFHGWDSIERLDFESASAAVVLKTRGGSFRVGAELHTEAAQRELADFVRSTWKRLGHSAEQASAAQRAAAKLRERVR
ncbi:MAG: hypothetical protein KC912_00820 [Proteobacteria bacterium]|nr:hypothetical protein [Pseudomonadota bacterium]